MVKLFRNIVLFTFVLIQTLFSIKSSAQGLDQKKALWIVQNILPNVDWRNENSITKLTIGVYGSSAQVYDELLNLSKTRKIDDKPFTVVRFRRSKEITYTHVLYVEPNNNSEVKSILAKLNANTLLITDQYTDIQSTMLNLLDIEKAKKKFEINQEVALNYNITFNRAILLFGGNPEDLNKLTRVIENEIKRIKDKLERQKNDLTNQQIDLSRLKLENQKQREENERQLALNNKQKLQIEDQQKEIEEQRDHVVKVQENLTKQQESLNTNNKVLEEQKKKLTEQQEEVQKRNDEIESQLAEIEKNKRIIEGKTTTLIDKESLIQSQRIILIVFLALIALIVVLAFYIWRGYLIKQKINDELRVKNIAINKQKEEIISQHRQTDLLNKELEKLSIVAARTDNAVTIMDSTGNYEWVNVGYTRLYGYTLQLLTHEVDENIIGVSNHPEIKQILERCIKNKKTEVFESKNRTRNGIEFWAQTSLTPILDEESNIKKLITIETDITKIKEAETEIRNQHNKILEQTQQLEATNKELEKLSLVASETENAIAIMDAAGNFQWINDGFSRLYEYTYEQLISEYSGNIITKDTGADIIELIKSCIEEQKPVTYEIKQKTRSNNEIWVQITLTPIVDKGNNLRSLISIASDISKLKQAEQEIRQLSEELLTQKEELILQKDQIEMQNLNIKASITYAKTIQNAILPPNSSLNKYYETFVIYKPKDIVSGDFYWHSLIPARNGNNETAFYAAVDCTGHGVPGAFMSMIGSSLLNEIVNEKKITKPSLILDILNHEIKAILRQEQTDNSDGMDVCLCALEHIDNGTVKMTFSGAKRPLFYYKTKESSLKYIKGTRKTIGGTKAKRNREVFTDHEVLLNKGDLLYLTTDGIVDQPSPERIRYGSVRFVNLLKSVGSKPIDIQQESIEQAIIEYQKHEQQRDDVTLIGIKV